MSERKTFFEKCLVYLKKTVIYFNVYIISLSQSKLQLRYLATAFSICISIVAITFGVSSNILDEYLRIESPQKYEFKSLNDVLSFPVEQHKFLNDIQIQNLETASSSKKTITELRILDITTTREDDDIYQKLVHLNKEATRKVRWKNTNQTENALLTEFCIRNSWSQISDQTRNKITSRLYLMNPVCPQEYNPQSLNEITNQNPYLVTDSELKNLKSEITESWPKRCEKAKTIPRLDLFFRELTEEILNVRTAKEEKIFVTILSDFNDEKKGEVSDELEDAIQDLSQEHSNITFNLVKFPSLNNAKSDNSKKVIIAIDEMFDVNLIDLTAKDELTEFNGNQILRFFSSSRFSSKKLMLGKRINSGNNDGGYRGFESSASFNMNPGEYEFKLSPANGSSTKNLILLHNSIPYAIGEKPTTVIKVLSTDTLKIINKGDSQYDYLGTLEIFNLNEIGQHDFSLWQMRVLNSSSIGFIMVGISSLILLFLMFIFLLAETTKIFLKKPKRKILKIAIILLPYLAVLLVLLFSLNQYRSFPDFIEHLVTNIYEDAFDPYLFLLILTIFFVLTRKYEKLTHNDYSLKKYLKWDGSQLIETYEQNAEFTLSGLGEGLSYGVLTINNCISNSMSNFLIPDITQSKDKAERLKYNEVDVARKAVLNFKEGNWTVLMKMKVMKKDNAKPVNINTENNG